MLFIIWTRFSIAEFPGIGGRPPTSIRAGSPPQWQSMVVRTSVELLFSEPNRRAGSAGAVMVGAEVEKQATMFVLFNRGGDL